MPFPLEVQESLGFYVYRLIDPRSGETFYVGKGQGNRVFDHAGDALVNPEETDKLNRIRAILNSGLEILHIIHRHGMNERTALEVEAALIDAYPGLTNIVGGVGNGDRGVMHANQIIQLYTAAEADLRDRRALILKLNTNALEQNLYEATRFAWKLNIQRARRAEFVLAVVGGIIRDVFIADDWLVANEKNFPGRLEYPDDPRFGFTGEQAEDSIRNQYIGRSIPQCYRNRGAASPFRYTYR